LRAPRRRRRRHCRRQIPGERPGGARTRHPCAPPGRAGAAAPPAPHARPRGARTRLGPPRRAGRRAWARRPPHLFAPPSIRAGRSPFPVPAAHPAPAPCFPSPRPHAHPPPLAKPRSQSRNPTIPPRPRPPARAPPHVALGTRPGLHRALRCERLAARRGNGRAPRRPGPSRTIAIPLIPAPRGQPRAACATPTPGHPCGARAQWPPGAPASRGAICVCNSISGMGCRGRAGSGPARAVPGGGPWAGPWEHGLGGTHRAPRQRRRRRRAPRICLSRPYATPRRGRAGGWSGQLRSGRRQRSRHGGRRRRGGRAQRPRPPRCRRPRRVLKAPRRSYTDSGLSRLLFRLQPSPPTGRGKSTRRRRRRG
jgi:hypothetical protein